MPDGHQPCHHQLTKYTTLVDMQMRYVKLQSLINSHTGPECRESAQDQRPALFKSKHSRSFSKQRGKSNWRIINPVKGNLIMAQNCHIWMLASPDFEHIIVHRKWGCNRYHFCTFSTTILNWQGNQKETVKIYISWPHTLQCQVTVQLHPFWCHTKSLVALYHVQWKISYTSICVRLERSYKIYTKPTPAWLFTIMSSFGSPQMLSEFYKSWSDHHPNNYRGHLQNHF